MNTEELQVMNLYEIPEGKHSFTARVKEITEKESVDYWGNFIWIPYVFFKDIKVLIKETWFNVNTSGICINSKIGKRIEKLNLECEDLIAFDAKVEEEATEFFSTEKNDDMDDDDEPTVYLPKDYNDLILVDIYETEFSLYERLSKNNYIESYDRTSFNKKIKKLNCKREATYHNPGFYREVQGMYYRGRSIKNLSNIEKY